MNLSALPELLLAWVKTQGAAMLQGNKAEQASPFKIGAQYEGKVLDQLPSGRHLVQVAGQRLDMGLPRNTQAGDTVRLTFMNAGPRPTFLLDQGQASSVQQVRISNTAQQVNALMRFSQVSPQSLNPASPEATTTSPGSTARVAPHAATAYHAAARIAEAPRAATLATPRSVIDTTQALVEPAKLTGGNPSASPASAQGGMGAAAAKIVAQGGLAAQSAPAAQTQSGPAAATGSRPIVANVVMLQAAPAPLPGMPVAVASANTGLLGQAVDGLRASVPASTTLKPTVVADIATPSPSLLPARLAQTLQESGLFYEAHQARWVKGAYPFEALLSEPQARLGRAGLPMTGLAELGGMPEEAARLAGRQLHMLEGGPFLWQGFAWPGQWVAWLVEERWGGEGQEGEDEAPGRWDTELSLTLPRMGTVHARLSLRGRDVSLRLDAVEPSTIDLLRAALPALQQGLQAAGLQPAALLVEEA